MTENELQSQIMAALQAICQDNKIDCSNLSFYANQQGEGLNRFAADFCSIIDNGYIYMFEVKVLDLEKNELTKFDSNQFVMNCHFVNDLNLPIYYIYNNIEILSATCPNRHFTYYLDTLEETNFSKPTPLPGKKPDIHNHEKTINLFSKGHKQYTPEHMGFILSSINKNTVNKNALLVFIYNSSVNKAMCSEMGADDITALNLLMKKLNEKPNKLNKKENEILKKYLSGSDIALAFFENERYKSEAKKNKRDKKI
ncbi:hypothetical protein [uncultured Cedecea sp.]|uniref:hypothetical protein n=1 Tax=uncultured Cedecea sp. TaxID=988762 RepID=UPI002619C2D7|nr:hypothetical protein [uncultured Cedecea sp.]